MLTFMDAARVKPALSTNPPSEVDRLSSLPDCLIFQIFLNLMTKDVVQTSALSTRWTTLWKDVHGLDLDTEDFNIHETFVSFVDNFLERNRGSSIHLFKVTYDSSNKPDLVNRWVDTAVRLKVEHLDVSDILSAQDIMMNPTRVSLPSLKDIVLILVEYTNRWALEKLISQCPVLENVSIDRIYGDGMPILRLKLMLPCLNMVRDFLVGISKVKDLTIASSTLEVIYDYARYVQLPVFRNLYTLCVRFNSYMLEMLPVFLEVCPNLKTLVVGTSENYLMVGITVIARPWNLLSSLEHVDIERPLKGEALEMALVGYLLENSPNLKKLSLSLHDSLKKGKSVHKLTLSLDDAPKKEESDIFIELLNFTRRSSSCQIIVP
ncbi:unnamed protein product [Brassica napus]|uniref:F-box domain-containing protein n=2 Tax=Brassica TaxID=3705 RepID=A0A3P6G205_BRAOL|nr:unnamed protein product [Brassica napus]VDD64827.1 unnamed protein product [Brassica oleracea]